MKCISTARNVPQFKLYLLITEVHEEKDKNRGKVLK